MAISKERIHRMNNSGSYDIIHHETDSDVVIVNTNTSGVSNDSLTKTIADIKTTNVNQGNDISALKNTVGTTPTVVTNTSAMTDHSKIYVLTTDGNWYYWDSTQNQFTSGGSYTGAAVQTDKNLTTENRAADGKATGNMIIVNDTQPSASTTPSNKLWIKNNPEEEITVPTYEEFEDVKNALLLYNAVDVLANGTHTSRTNNGVTFTWSADNSQCTVFGTSTGIATTYLYSDAYALPYGIQPGETYHVVFSTSDNHCYFEIISYDANQQSTSTSFVVPTDYTVPDDAVGMYIRLRVSNTATVNLTVPCPKILTTMSNADLEKLAMETNAIAEDFKYTGVICATYVSSEETFVAPYDDCNTIPNGDIVTYGTNYVPFHAPTGFAGGTIITLSGRNRNFSVGGTVQFCVFKTGKMFTRIRWGSNADAYTEWKIISYESHTENSNMTSLATFFKIGVVGDSFSSGSITHLDQTFDRYIPLSWPQVLGREIGATVTNYTWGGFNTKEWLDDATHGLAKLLAHDPEQIYYLALGINDYNDIDAGTETLGTIADIKSDFTQNPDTFYGNYGRIIGNIQSHAPNAIIVMLSILRPWTTTKSLNTAIEEIASHFNIPYIFCDNDSFFTSSFYVNNMANNHPVAVTYAGMAKAIRRLTESFMVDHPSYFREYYGL